MKNDRIKVIHLTEDHEGNIETFIPRIPNHRAGGEDDKIERICVSTSIEGCIKAHPSIWYHVEYMDMENACPYTDMDRKVVLLDNDEIGGLLLKAYEFHLPIEKLVTPNTLKENNLVPDAMETQEHWILEEAIPNSSYYVLLMGGEHRVSRKARFDYKIFELEKIGRIVNALEHFDRKRREELNWHSIFENPQYA